jgi:hypothetical protein
MRIYQANQMEYYLRISSKYGQYFRKFVGLCPVFAQNVEREGSHQICITPLESKLLELFFRKIRTVFPQTYSFAGCHI